MPISIVDNSGLAIVEFCPESPAPGCPPPDPPAPTVIVYVVPVPVLNARY